MGISFSVFFLSARSRCSHVFLPHQSVGHHLGWLLIQVWSGGAQCDHGGRGARGVLPGSLGGGRARGVLHRGGREGSRTQCQEDNCFFIPCNVKTRPSVSLLRPSLFEKCCIFKPPQIYLHQKYILSGCLLANYRGAYSSKGSSFSSFSLSLALSAVQRNTPQACETATSSVCPPLPRRPPSPGQPGQRPMG